MNAFRAPAALRLSAAVTADAVPRAVACMAEVDFLTRRSIIKLPLTNDLFARSFAVGTDAGSVTSWATCHGMERSGWDGIGCPLGCPLASGRRREFSCNRDASGRVVPANVSPSVRPPVNGCAYVRGHVRQETVESADGPGAHAGVVPSCPLAGPLASGWCSDHAALLISPCSVAVPAKESGKSEQHRHVQRGGGS